MLEPNVVNNNDTENKDSKGYNSNNNFKLKGPKGWAHKLKKGAKQAAKKAAGEFFKNIMRKLFFVLFKYVFIILLIASASIFVAAAFWYVINLESDKETESAVGTVISNSTTISEKAKDTYEKKGSLVYFKNDEYKEIANEYLDSIKKTNERLYEVMSEEDYIGDHKISELSYVNGFDISNTYEFILNAERLNFNRVSWKKSNRATGEITELETQTDEETNLKYPKNDEDTTKELDYFVDMVTPYLQSYVIPNTMLSGIVTKADNVQVANFAFQIIDKGYHVIDVLQFTLQTAKRDRTKKHYITENVTLTEYEKSYDCSYTDGEGNLVEQTCTDYGYSSRELDSKKETVREHYEAAHESNSEIVEIYKKFDSTVEKQFVYPIIKADTLKEFMRKEYEQKIYSDEDVENYTNSDQSYVTNTEEYSKVTGLGGYEDISGSGWSRSGGTIQVKVDSGDYITTKYIWNDKLEEKYNEKRNYEVNDVSEFVNQTDKIIEVEQRALTEEEKKAGSRPDLRIDATEIFGMTEVNYYEALEEEKDITRIDMINATPSIYNDYLFEGEVYSDYIGFSRSYLSLSYTLLNRHLTELEELQKASGSLGLSFDVIGSNFIWPLKETGGEAITSCVGTRIRTWDAGKSEYHGAMDIGAPNGYSIVASQSGVIYRLLRESESGGYGNMVMIKHGEVGEYVYYTLYAHMNSFSGTNGLNLKVGDTVEAGQVIGYVGSTGDSTGNHLHFELIPWPKSDNNGEQYFNKKKYNTIEPILYIQRNTIPERILNQASLPSNCTDLSNDDFGKYAATSSEGSSNATASSSNTGTTYSGGKFVFSQEITSALSSASYNNSTFNRTLTSAGSYYKTTGISDISGVSYSARTKPDTFAAKDAAIKNMSDLEILSRTIYAEQGSNSEEAGVLVGITVLNRVKKDKSSISAVLTGKYESDTKYNYNCVSGNVFWGDIPAFAKDLAIKALAAVDKGSYVVAGVECINIESFHASTTINSGDSYRISENDLSVGSTWYNWKRYLVLENTISGFKYTGFYGW